MAGIGAFPIGVVDGLDGGGKPCMTWCFIQLGGCRVAVGDLPENHPLLFGLSRVNLNQSVPV